MKVNYIYKKESDGASFSSTSSNIELKEYMDDLVFYSPMNNLYKAEYCMYDKAAIYSTKPEVFTGGVFGSYLKIKDSYSFERSNFNELKDNARISFYVSPNKIIEKEKIGLRANKNFPEEGLKPGDYSFTVTVEGHPTSTMVLRCLEQDGTTVKMLKNKILFQLDPIVYPFEINAVNNEKNLIVLQSNFKGRTMKVSDGLDGNNLLDYFDVESVEYGSAPKTDTDIFKLFNLTITHIRDITSGSDKSYLRFTLESEEKNQVIEVPWNNNSIDMDNIEINFDDNLIYIFINGKLVKIELLEVHFTPTEQTLELLGGDFSYSFDEIIINNKCLHTKDFIPDNKQLTKYSVKKPYIDFYYSGLEVKNGMELKTAQQAGIHCCICADDCFYYYSAGAWRRARGNFQDTNDWDTFTEKLKDFSYSGNDFFIRMFFFSDGCVNSFINVPYFEMNEELYQDKNGNIAAILVGDKEWSWKGGPVLEDLMDKKLVIITDKGTTNIDFTLDDEELEEWKSSNNNSSNNSSSDNGSSDNGSSEEERLYLWGIRHTIEKINSYYPDGILKCEKDTRDRVILVSETKGEDAFIMVRGNAVPIIFGSVCYAKGTNENSGTIDYTEFYDAVRTYTGEPLIPMEITDEQMRLFLKEALNYYKRFKADDLNQYSCQLKGNWKDGYEIPSVIETHKDIVDIIFKPIFPITFYGSDFIDNGSENIFTLTLAQSLFGGRGNVRQGQGITQDYYISLMAMQDFKQALGLNPSWEILNNRIYIYPSQVSRFTNVSIKYKAPLSEEACLKDPDMIKYVHGKCLMTMGNIRGQYGGSITAGEASLQFNANELYERGKAIVDEVLEYWRKTTPPMGFFLG